MILLCMVGFIKYQEINVVHPNVGMHKAPPENLGSANNHHVPLKMLDPDILRPKVRAHCATEMANILVNIVT
jgi:hypothetical protein